jgi:hypothetical protein
VYLQHNAPKLYESINDLCLFGALNARGKRGVTLLLPDKDEIKKIVGWVGTDTMKAHKAISALILPVYVKNLSEFTNGSIPNKLGFELPVDMDKSTASAVKLEGGATITKLSFDRLHAEGNYMIYSVSGTVPHGSVAVESSGKKGGYSGGNDGQMQEHTLYASSDQAWVNVVTHLKTRTVALAGTRGRGNLSEPDPLTLATVSFMNWLKNSDEHKELSGFLCKVFPISPLTFLHIGHLVTDSDRKTWSETHDMKYVKLDVLGEIMGTGGMNSGSNMAEKAEKIRGFAGATAGTKALDCAKSIIGKLNPSSTMLEKYWGGGVDACAEWYLASWEYIGKFTVPYINALKNSDSNMRKRELTAVFDVHLRYAANAAASKEYNTMRILTNCPGGSLCSSSTEIFCAIVALVMGQMGTAGGDLDTLAKIRNGSDSNGVYYGELPPNSIKHSSFAHIVAAFWIATLTGK